LGKKALTLAKTRLREFTGEAMKPWQHTRSASKFTKMYFVLVEYSDYDIVNR
jgi:hypothetical protein